MGGVSQLPARPDEAPIVSADTIERVLVGGDLSTLSADQRLEYIQGVCASLGLNPLTRPFEFITLSGRLTLYARRDATDQLRRLHSVSVEITARDKLGDVWCVTARATTPTGRSDESVGAVPIANLKGEALANALMKAETKAKRRVTLSICGLGILDETEVDSARPVSDGDGDAAPECVSTETFAALRERIRQLPEGSQDDLRALAREIGATGPVLTVAQYDILQAETERLEREEVSS